MKTLETLVLPYSAISTVLGGISEHWKLFFLPVTPALTTLCILLSNNLADCSWDHYIGTPLRVSPQLTFP